MTDCGCRVKMYWEHTSVADGEILYCPLHKAAPEMFEALKNLLHQVEHNGELREFVIGDAVHAIAKAKGNKE